MYKVHEVYDNQTNQVVRRRSNLIVARSDVTKLNDDHKMSIALRAVNLAGKGGWKRPTNIIKTENEYGITIKTEVPNPKHILLMEMLDKLKGERYTVKSHSVS